MNKIIIDIEKTATELADLRVRELFQATYINSSGEECYTKPAKKKFDLYYKFYKTILLKNCN